MVFVLDPCGIFCVILTYVVVFYADYVVMFHLIQPVLKEGFAAIFNTVAFNLVAFLLALSHLSAVFGDPGLMPLGQYPLTHDGSFQKPQGWTTCTRCSMFRPPRAHHCRVCRRCVRRMDHHCPWVNNCVGEYNQKYFILFLLYTGALCLYALILVIVCRAVLSSESNQQVAEVDPFVVAHTVLLIAICCLFGLFVLAILSDQYKSIVEDETAIEALQQRLTSGPPYELDVEVAQCRRRLPKRLLFREVFGAGPACLWLLPCHHMWQSSRSNAPCAPLFSHSSASVPDVDPRQASDSSGAGSTETDSASL